jgi:hypothetical protein
MNSSVRGGRGFEFRDRCPTRNLHSFNYIGLGPKTPTAPGRGEKAAFGERFGRSLRSQSPEFTGQPPGKLGVFRAVSPAESSWPLGWWRRLSLLRLKFLYATIETDAGARESLRYDTTGH